MWTESGMSLEEHKTKEREERKMGIEAKVDKEVKVNVTKRS
jgi:hypothetical protein